MWGRPFSACLMTALLALVPCTSAAGAPADRANDPQPHRGGAAITTTVSSTLFDCTAGFAVRRVEDGKRAMVTAGHCSDAQKNVPVVSGEFTYGSVARAFFDDGSDAGLITGTPTKPQVYAPTIWTDGGPPGEPVARRVLGKSDAPVVGQKVCVSGKVTKLLCDVEVFSLSEGKECEEKPQPRRCTFGLAIGVKEHTVVSQPADSGAPVFVPVDKVVDGHQVHGAVIIGMLVAGGPRV
ncbi:hypothetical protein GCM10010289_62800 [Streptomyces violascens]|uniref:Serine protease n=2 Tax=Streptomyces violascens TaxID=67381 RepID=A0ABQ3QSF6_9ACTN|nr:hypothetical protein GCM10010289_62800 [Streptomyces violascens]GHI40221.1 hypothetical protein Sviol_46290 [Streptomyces violascens]